MQDSSPLSSERKKELRSRHPLYSKLSGDVVWVLFEETGCDESECGAAMDAFIEDMHTVLEAMDRLERQQANYLLLHAGQPMCAPCAEIVGKAFSSASPDWQNLLPPFAVGCRLTCSALNSQELQRSGYAVCSPEQTPQRPDCPLLCPLYGNPR